jgi:hypothetical protein
LICHSDTVHAQGLENGVVEEGLEVGGLLRRLLAKFFHPAIEESCVCPIYTGQPLCGPLNVPELLADLVEADPVNALQLVPENGGSVIHNFCDPAIFM